MCPSWLSGSLRFSVCLSFPWAVSLALLVLLADIYGCLACDLPSQLDHSPCALALMACAGCRHLTLGRLSSHPSQPQLQTHLALG